MLNPRVRELETRALKTFIFTSVRSISTPGEVVCDQMWNWERVVDSEAEVQRGMVRLRFEGGILERLVVEVNIVDKDISISCSLGV